MNDLDRARTLADAALRALAPEDGNFRSGVHGALGDTYRRNGHWREAHEHYLLGLQHVDNPEGHIQELHAFGGLADLELRQGHLRAAASYWDAALRKVRDPTLWGVYPLPLTGWLHTRYGDIHYEWNDLETATTFAALGLERAELGGDPRSLIASSLLTARLHLARGETDEAQTVLNGVRPVIADAEFHEWASEFDRCQVDLWLAQHRLRTAVIWSDEVLTDDLLSRHDSEPTTLAAARVLIVKGAAADLDRAITLVRTLERTAAADGRGGLQIAALSIQAMASRERGDQARALTAIEHALRLAEPEGYVRSFVDLGLPMVRLLQDARSRGISPDYVHALLSAFDASLVAGLPAGSQLPEALSDREREILQYIAAGLTNREIADTLFISSETVKKHTGNIYGKLGVRSRTEAIARARTLELLS